MNTFYRKVADNIYALWFGNPDDKIKVTDAEIDELNANMKAAGKDKAARFEAYENFASKKEK